MPFLSRNEALLLEAIFQLRQGAAEALLLGAQLLRENKTTGTAGGLV